VAKRKRTQRCSASAAKRPGSPNRWRRRSQTPPGWPPRLAADRVVAYGAIARLWSRCRRTEAIRGRGCRRRDRQPRLQPRWVCPGRGDLARRSPARRRHRPAPASNPRAFTILDKLKGGQPARRPDSIRTALPGLRPADGSLKLEGWQMLLSCSRAFAGPLPWVLLTARVGWRPAGTTGGSRPRRPNGQACASRC
jgi:hypothetical protein